MCFPGDFLPTAPLENLRRRAELVRRVRAFFDERDFIEVATPQLSRDTVVDRYVEPFRVTLLNDPCQWQQGPTWYLQTSPEFHMKRLLVAGATAIYQIASAFRAAEIGPRHNLEFSILEWYRVGDDQKAAIDLLAEMFASLAGTSKMRRLSYQAAFEEVVRLDPFAAPIRQLQEQAGGLVSDDRDELLDWILAEQIVPAWDPELPTILFDYPASQSALATVRDEQPRKAERFELYWRGTELANGYHELRSADVLRERFSANNRLRQAAGRQPLPLESRLLTAMQAGELPPCTGVAMGLDRFVMLMLGQTELSQVVAFPTSRA